MSDNGGNMNIEGPQAPTPRAQYPATPPVQTMPKVDGLAIASLVLGIVWVYWIGSILAVIFAGVALKRINESNGWRTGKGMAVAGLVLGLVGVSTLALIILITLGSSS